MMACISLPGSTAFSGEKPEVFVQMGHSMAIQASAVSPDGRCALSGSFDNTLKLWDVASGREIQNLYGASKHGYLCRFQPRRPLHSVGKLR